MGFLRQEYWNGLSFSLQQVKTQLELDMEQQTGSKLGKELCQGCILLPSLYNFYVEYIM